MVLTLIPTKTSISEDMEVEAQILTGFCMHASAKRIRDLADEVRALESILRPAGNVVRLDDLRLPPP